MRTTYTPEQVKELCGGSFPASSFKWERAHHFAFKGKVLCAYGGPLENELLDGPGIVFNARLSEQFADSKK